jgi:hypothetical protein
MAHIGERGSLLARAGANVVNDLVFAASIVKVNNAGRTE